MVWLTETLKGIVLTEETKQKRIQEEIEQLKPIKPKNAIYKRLWQNKT